MFDFLENTIVVSAPKRSGGTLLTRLFDGQPGVCDFVDEGYFWEHAYNYESEGLEQLFVNIFKSFPVEEIENSLIDRDLLPWCEGVYKQTVPYDITCDLDWNREVFLSHLDKLKGAKNISDLWNGLVYAYTQAVGKDYSNNRTAFLHGGDYGRAMLTTKKTLKKSKGIFVMRNPYYAMESLKKGRIIRDVNVLHPVNFGQNLSYYYFFWNNRDQILHEDTMLVRFEDIVMNPEETMRKIADHVDVEFTDNLLVPTLRGKSWVGDSSFHELKGIDKSTVSRPIKTLNNLEIDFIKENLKDLIDFFDYELPEVKN